MTRRPIVLLAAALPLLGVERCDPDPEPTRSLTTRDGLVFIDGDAFVPTGVFFWPNIARPSGKDPFRVLRGYGFDTVVAYWEYVKPGNTSTNQPDLDDLVAQCDDAQAGLYFFVDVADTSLAAKTSAEIEAFVDPITDRLAKSKCFLGYSIDEWEMRGISADDAKKVADAMRAHEEDVLVWFNFGPADNRWSDPGYPDLRGYAAAGDIVSIDFYPLEADSPPPYTSHYALQDVGWFVDQVKSWAPEGKPVWFYQQGHKQSDIGAGSEGRRPNAVETRFMSWQVVVHGGTGLLAFTGAPLGQEIPSDDPTWDQYLRATFAEVKSLSAVIASRETAPAVSASDAAVAVASRVNDGRTTVFAVREADGDAVSVEITVAAAADGTADVLGEDRTVAVTGGRITDTFERYAVHLYALR